MDEINLDGIKNSREIEDDSEEVTENESDEENDASFESNSKADILHKHIEVDENEEEDNIDVEHVDNENEEEPTYLLNHLIIQMLKNNQF